MIQNATYIGSATKKDPRPSILACIQVYPTCSRSREGERTSNKNEDVEK